MKKLDHIIEFYGETCPHCISMRPVIAQLEKDMDAEITKLEVWNHPENEQIMKKYEEQISQACGGFAAVPSFVNTQTGQALCGAHDADAIKALIDGADCSGHVCQVHSKMAEKPAKPAQAG